MKKTLKILQIGPGKLPIPPNGWGGVEKVVWKWSENLRKFGHKVDIFNIKNNNKLMKTIRDGKYDIIHSHTKNMAEFLNKYKVKHVHTCHHSEWMNKWKYFNSLFSNKYCIPMLFKQMHERHGKGFFIENGADEKLFYPEEKIKNKCISTGKDSPRKRFAKIAQIVSKHPSLTWHLIGPGNDKHKISNNIIVYPNLSEIEIAKHYRDAEYFIHLSEKEADSLSVREAALSGCKMILSNYCADTIGNDISFKDINNITSCPEDLGEKCHGRAINWTKVAKHLEGNYFKIVNS